MGPAHQRVNKHVTAQRKAEMKTYRKSSLDWNKLEWKGQTRIYPLSVVYAAVEE